MVFVHSEQHLYIFVCVCVTVYACALITAIVTLNVIPRKTYKDILKGAHISVLALAEHTYLTS